MNTRSFSLHKLALIYIALLLVTHAVKAQENNDEPPKIKSEFWKKVRFGGGLGLGTGNGFFSATLAPSAIYEFNNNIALGLGLNGTYSSRKDQFSSTILGGSIISLFSPIREIQLSAEFEELHVNRKYKGAFSSLEDDNYWYPALFIGAGYRNNNFTIGIRYDVLYDDEKSIYQNAWAPFVRVYF